LHSSNYTVLAAPSAPSFISFSEVTSSTLNVSWGFPLSPNGLVEGYRVVYEPTAPIQGQSLLCIRAAQLMVNRLQSLFKHPRYLIPKWQWFSNVY